jgi:regulator of nucleoside diphosphate kinase
LRSEITRRDAEKIAEWLARGDAAYMSDGPDVSDAIALALNRAQIPDVTVLFNQGGRFFLAEERGVPAGFLRLATGGPDVQIVLMVERGRRGRGVGRAMLREALKVAFFEMRAPRVLAVIHRDNHRSLRLFGRAGFRMETGGGLWTRHALSMRDYIRAIQEGTDMERKLYITKLDRERLTRLIDDALFGNAESDKAFRVLEAELARATVVSPNELPADAVSMRSRTLIALDGEEEEVSLVYPDEADWASGKLSILSPIGTALIGYREGDSVEWRVPGGLKRIEIKKVLYQPEAAGDLEL